MPGIEKIRRPATALDRSLAAAMLFRKAPSGKDPQDPECPGGRY
jgi:hypothetical protein